MTLRLNIFLIIPTIFSYASFACKITSDHKFNKPINNFIKTVENINVAEVIGIENVCKSDGIQVEFNIGCYTYKFRNIRVVKGSRKGVFEIAGLASPKYAPQRVPRENLESLFKASVSGSCRLNLGLEFEKKYFIIGKADHPQSIQSYEGIFDFWSRYVDKALAL